MQLMNMLLEEELHI